MSSKRKRDEGASRHPEKKKETRSTRQTSDRKKSILDPRSRFTNFTPLVMPIEHVLMQIKDESSLQWPQPIYAQVEVRGKSEYCR